MKGLGPFSLGMGSLRTPDGDSLTAKTVPVHLIGASVFGASNMLSDYPLSG